MIAFTLLTEIDMKNINIFEELAKSPCHDLKINELVDNLPLTIRDALLTADSQKIRETLSNRKIFSDFQIVTCTNAVVEEMAGF